MRNTEFEETLQYIRKTYKGEPKVGIVLGTGLGGLVDVIEAEKTLAYNFIPHFPISTVESHFGKLIFGKIGNVDVVAMQGRFHYYEGYSMQQITYPIRVMKMLGIKALFLSNAAGSLNPQFKKGELMVIEDHINLLPENPLRGPNVDELGPRFPDMSEPYDKKLIASAHAFAKQENIRLNEGVYVSVSGPNLETRAEYRFLRYIGGDVVGMSTVPEVIVSNHMGLRTFAMTIITDECDPKNLIPLTVEEVIATAKNTEPYLTGIFKHLITTETW